MNRRRKQRLACLLIVQYRLRADAAAPWRPAPVLDLNERGCRLSVAEPLPAGAALLLRFDALLHDGVESAELDAAASVMWCRPRASAESELGVAFASAPPGLSEILRVLGVLGAPAPRSPGGAARRGRSRSPRASGSRRAARARRSGE